MESNDGNELLLKRLRETLSAEKAILSALPRLAMGASADDQTKRLESYMQRTSERIQRLEQIPDLVAQPQSARPAIAAVFAELDELFDDAGGVEIRQAAATSVLEALSHLLIARYATLTSWALLLGKADLADDLLATLSEQRREIEGSTAARGREKEKDISLGERLTALFDRRK